MNLDLFFFSFIETQKEKKNKYGVKYLHLSNDLNLIFNDNNKN